MALDFFLCLATAVMMSPGSKIGGIHFDRSSVTAGLPFALSVLVWAQISGLYRNSTKTSTFLVMAQVMGAVLPAALALYALQALWGAVKISNEAAIAETSVAVTIILLSRVLWRRHRDRLYQAQMASRNFLIVGVDETGRDVRSYLTGLQQFGYRFQGFVAICEPTDDPHSITGDDVVGEIHDVIQIARSKFVDEIIFTRRPATPGVLSTVLRQARVMGVSVRLIPSLTETLVDRSDIELLGDLPTISVFVAQQRHVSFTLKRLLDLSIASSATIALLPLFAVIAIAIRLQSKGPVFYLSQRVGHKGRIFTCFKFRTMVANAAQIRAQLEHKNEREGAFFKITKDPRVTPVGAFLRKYSLDELPQLLNVIRGDMSLVGPRPPLDSEAVRYKPEHLRRLDAVPGMTGLWQVEARQDPSFEKFVALDSSYINNWSLLLDLKILARTFTAVVRGTGS